MTYREDRPLTSVDICFAPLYGEHLRRNAFSSGLVSNSTAFSCGLVSNSIRLLKRGMEMGYRQVAILCAAPFMVSSAALAANLNVAQGEVLLSHGAGFETLTTSTELSVGDTVIGKPGSAAQISFADGCAVPLGVGTVFRVGKLSPCGTHSAGLGASGATETPTDGPAPPTTEEHKTNFLPYVLGAAAVGGIVAVAVSAGGGDGGGGGGGDGGNGGGDGGNGPGASP